MNTRVVLSIGLILLLFGEMKAAISTAQSSGNWASITWSNGVPGSGDDVIIDGVNVTYDANTSTTYGT